MHDMFRAVCCVDVTCTYSCREPCVCANVPRDMYSYSVPCAVNHVTYIRALLAVRM